MRQACSFNRRYQPVLGLHKQEDLQADQHGSKVPGGMELQTVTFRYKRGFRYECICHEDVYR
jgi:hypothetical protein